MFGVFICEDVNTRATGLRAAVGSMLQMLLISSVVLLFSQSHGIRGHFIGAYYSLHDNEIRGIVEVEHQGGRELYRVHAGNVLSATCNHRE